MSKNVEIVKKLVAACEAKDMKTVRSLVSDDYTLRDPMMSLNGPDELVQMLESCPFDGTMKEVHYLDAGDTVVMTAECIMTKPERFSWRMCDVLTLENGKVRAEEMFYDTAQFPDSLKNAPSEIGTKKKPKAA